MNEGHMSERTASSQPEGLPMATDWATCPAVERDPEKLSGALVFRGTRMPVATLFENLQHGATIEQFLEWYPGTTREQVDAVIDHLTHDMQAPVVREAEEAGAIE